VALSYFGALADTVGESFKSQHPLVGERVSAGWQLGRTPWSKVLSLVLLPPMYGQKATRVTINARWTKRVSSSGQRSCAASPGRS